MLEDFRSVVDHIYGPERYFARIREVCNLLDMSGVNGNIHPSQSQRDMEGVRRLLWNITWKRPDLRRHVWSLLWYVIRKKPRAIKAALYNAALYAHLGPFSRTVVAEISDQIANTNDNPVPASVERIGLVEPESVSDAELPVRKAS